MHPVPGRMHLSIDVAKGRGMRGEEKIVVWWAAGEDGGQEKRMESCHVNVVDASLCDSVIDPCELWHLAGTGWHWRALALVLDWPNPFVWIESGSKCQFKAVRLHRVKFPPACTLKCFNVGSSLFVHGPAKV